MTIPAGQSGVTYHTGNGTASTFDYEFKITAEADLKVTQTNTAGVDTVLVLNTDYTVTGVGNNAGGSITLVAGALASNYTLAIEDNVEVSQLTPFGNQSAFYANLHEDAYDKNTRIARKSIYELDRVLKIPASVQGVDTELPKPEGLNLFRWNEGGTALENVDTDDLITTAQFSNFKTDTFVDGIDFTAGTTTTVTLASSPGTKSNTQVYFDGVYQEKSEYSLSAKVITFDTPIPIGVGVVEVVHGTAADILAPSTREVQIADGVATAYTLSNSYEPGNGTLHVYINGVRQEVGYGYAETNDSTVTFDSAPANGDRLLFLVNPYAPQTTADANNVTYTHPGSGAVATNVGARLSQIVSVKDFGAAGDGVTDDTAAIQAAIAHVANSDFHQKLFLPAGRYIVTDTLVVNAATDADSSTDHRNLILEGEGGMQVEPATVVRFQLANNAKNGLELTSCFGVHIEHIGFTSNNSDIKNVVIVNADPTPAFSGSLITFKNCYFNAFTTMATEAVVQCVNNKNVTFDSCWIGVPNPSDHAMRLGGNVADNAAFLQQGEMNLFHLKNCFIFGKVMVRKLRNFVIEGNAFVEGYGSCIDVEGDKDLHGGIIQANYFTGVRSEATRVTAITLGSFASLGGEDAGCVTIVNNRFRYRSIGIQVEGKGPYIIENNHFRPDVSGDKAIVISATAEDVHIGPNDFKDIQAINGVISIDDQRHTFATDEPTTNNDLDIVVDAVLTADDSSISEVSTTVKVLEATNVFLRGGKYRVRCQVFVRNTDATDSLPYVVQLRYRDQSNALHEIGCVGYGYIPATSEFSSGFSARDSVYIDRIVNLPSTTSNIPTLSAFELYVRNTGDATPASGYVEGNTTELGGDVRTWMQVEEYR